MFIKKIWAQYELDQIIQVRKGLFLVRFVHVLDKISVEKRGFYFFGNKPFVVKGWNADLELNIDHMKTPPYGSGFRTSSSNTGVSQALAR